MFSEIIVVKVCIFFFLFLLGMLRSISLSCCRYLQNNYFTYQTIIFATRSTATAATAATAAAAAAAAADTNRKQLRSIFHALFSAEWVETLYLFYQIKNENKGLVNLFFLSDTNRNQASYYLSCRRVNGTCCVWNCYWQVGYGGDLLSAQSTLRILRFSAPKLHRFDTCSREIRQVKLTHNREDRDKIWTHDL